MSFVRLENNEFPLLNQESQSIKLPKKKFLLNGNGDSCGADIADECCKSLNRCRHEPSKTTSRTDVVRCRVGYQINDYHEDLLKIFEEFRVGEVIDFIVTPIAPNRSQLYGPQNVAISDLVLPTDDWNNRIALNIGYPTVNNFDIRFTKYFQFLFDHALYLSAPVIIIDCPDSESGILTVASVVNNRLGELSIRDSNCAILFRVPLIDSDRKSSPTSWTVPCEPNNGQDDNQEANNSYDSSIGQNEPNTSKYWSYDRYKISEREREHRLTCAWNQWNNIRSHLIPDIRLGVCLTIDNELDHNDDELARWQGEPIRMIKINTDLFVKSPGLKGSTRLPGPIKEFIRNVTLKNSLMTSLVVEGRSSENIHEHMKYMDQFSRGLSAMNVDRFRNCNDQMRPPLQPLSMNLDSWTYSVFEADSPKYIKYREAMEEALKFVIEREDKKVKSKHKLVLMVLGAGRGPLVDCFIEAINKIKRDKYRFKLYALDKNPSSVLALKHKHKHQWKDERNQYETEVISSDMRTWEPGVKADIIATELLGSLGDNELSPECIDGVWRFSTSDTISIPLEYSSYIAPICSYKLVQEMNYCKQKGVEHVYDQVYVVRLSNFYLIDAPQRLFTFEHKDLSKPETERCNERHTKIVFWSKVDTVCHGFAGYFSSQLFGNARLSTVVNDKTPDMESWFPAFIPLEQPIQMAHNTKLVVHFWRKSSNSTVWYEWVVVDPVRSRIHSPNGAGTAMSKLI